ncbi:MAG TPA: UDP-N-acetylmuramoyl-L-alanine--D-glutamate ligase, partial [Patescibacteria group bacterium]|nr:UDP-N-acetylmuramoyl-L-alanine--D-glutamate ligase [Patescibacteria group bacterium]
KTKKIALLGLGIEGLSTAHYFLKHKIPFSVIDEKSKEELVSVSPVWEKGLQEIQEAGQPLLLGKPITSEVLLEFDIVLRSPGISPLQPYLKEFRGIITSQTKLFFSWSKGKIIGVTGTKGKGTTSTLIYEMLRQAGVDAYIGGNIGKPAFDFLDDLTENSYSVLELSSFQLMDADRSPSISVMLMVTNEHLDYHGGADGYHSAKQNIFKFQTSDDMAIINPDYEATRLSASVTPAKVVFVSRFQEVENGCFVRDNKVILRSNGFETDIIDVTDILLPGHHNLENVCAAVMVAHACGVGLSQIQGVLKTFKGLEHRLELVKELDGVMYYDDSIATNPESALAGIQAFPQPKVLILGGVTEGSDFTQVARYVAEDPSVKAIVGIGREWPVIKKLIEEYQDHAIEIREGFSTMSEVVTASRNLAEKGDIVLLSPACKSFDMFTSYKDRGEQFKHAVNLL